jgi:hypothetical protein
MSNNVRIFNYQYNYMPAIPSFHKNTVKKKPGGAGQGNVKRQKFPGIFGKELSSDKSVPEILGRNCHPTKAPRNFREGIVIRQKLPGIFGKELSPDKSLPEILGRNCHPTKASRKFREGIVI